MNGIEIIDEDMGPQVTAVFAGRLMSSEYVQMDDGKEKKALHKVHLDLITDSRQYIELLKSMEEGRPIEVQLVR